MVDFKGMKPSSRRTLGAPPPLAAASTNLSAPEIAPVAEPVSDAVETAPEPRRAQPRHTTPVEKGKPVDGRSLRRTDRVIKFSASVSPAWRKLLYDIAARDKLLICEVLERSLDAYEAQRREN